MSELEADIHAIRAALASFADNLPEESRARFMRDQFERLPNLKIYCRYSEEKLLEILQEKEKILQEKEIKRQDMEMKKQEGKNIKAQLLLAERRDKDAGSQGKDCDWVTFECCSLFLIVISHSWYLTHHYYRQFMI